MKLGIMQPYFFPYMGYFQLIGAVDRWVVFDVVQYMRHHWVNRNRVLKPGSSWQYITVPLARHQRETLIKDVMVDMRQDWKTRILAQLEHYKKKAPFFKDTLDFLRDCFFSADARTESLSALNTLYLRKTCERIGVGFDFSICSEIGLDLGDIDGPGEWALRISEALGADEYINPEGGRGIFAPEKFSAKGIGLKYILPKPSPYVQKGYEFVQGLSIIDVMMWNSADEISRMLSEYRITN